MTMAMISWKAQACITRPNRNDTAPVLFARNVFSLWRRTWEVLEVYNANRSRSVKGSSGCGGAVWVRSSVCGRAWMPLVT